MDAHVYRDSPVWRNTGLIVAEIGFSDTATAHGITVRSSSPVLLLCRKLIEAGYPPSARLECYRGSVLCLSVRSLAEGAALEINGAGTGFRPVREPDACPPVAPNGREAP